MKTLKKLSDKYSESTQKHPALWFFGSLGAGVILFGGPAAFRELADFKRRQIETLVELEMLTDIVTDEFGMNRVRRGPVAS